MFSGRNDQLISGHHLSQSLICLLRFSQHPEVAKALVEKGLVEGFKLDTSSEMPKLCDACEYGKAHRKPIKKECEAQKAVKIGDEVHSDVWGLSPVQTMGGREYYSTYADHHLHFT